MRIQCKNRDAAHRRFQAILTNDPTYRQAKYSTIVALQILGRLAMIEGDLNRAAETFGDAVARVAERRADNLLTAALAHDSTVALWREYRDRANLLQAAITARNGSTVQALQIDQAILGRWEAAVSLATNTDAFWILQKSRLQTGDDLAAMGH